MNAPENRQIPIVKFINEKLKNIDLIYFVTNKKTRKDKIYEIIQKKNLYGKARNQKTG